jgi:hypothetical protein
VVGAAAARDDDPLPTLDFAARQLVIAPADAVDDPD